MTEDEARKIAWAAITSRFEQDQTERRLGKCCEWWFYWRDDDQAEIEAYVFEVLNHEWCVELNSAHCLEVHAQEGEPFVPLPPGAERFEKWYYTRGTLGRAHRLWRR